MSQAPLFIGIGSGQNTKEIEGEIDFKSGVIFKSQFPCEGNVTHVHLLGFHDRPKVYDGSKLSRIKLWVY